MNDYDELEGIYKKAHLDNFYNSNGLRNLLKTVIRELYVSNRNEILQLKVNHLDHAIFKYNSIRYRRHIENPVQYFKACVLSAIREECLYSGFSDID
jgi:hypothetical protein